MKIVNRVITVTLLSALINLAQAHPPEPPPPFTVIEAAVSSLEAEVVELRREVGTQSSEHAELSSAVQEGFNSINASIAALGEQIESLNTGPSETRWISPLFIATADGSTASQTVDIAVMNPGDDSATVFVNLYRANGELIIGFSTELSVTAGGMEYYFVDARILTGQIHGWIEVTSDIPVLPSGTQITASGGSHANNTLTFFARD